ncbi:hypothetical protein PV08_01240 [Exophiala spinifera]|uniref:Uncharacterized protein n=1 Tax=Exophiala spinifera TaxID=91928 RepID=A0A0D2BP21_9EURO|nr:uncharacterized protein PV08_01240 [Exophiala spinifera]KIW20663.1 hypothetical protein PV08_01240 [Exophiala spinifera]
MVSHSTTTTARNDPLRAFADKSLPDLPVSFVPSSQSLTDEDEACPSPTVRVFRGPRKSPRYPRKLPQFQQSRKWAKVHDSRIPKPVPIITVTQLPTETPGGSDGIDDSANRALTMREVSFEQQRATKKPLARGRSSHRSSPSRVTSDDSIDSQDGSVCHPTSQQCLPTGKAGMAAVASTASKKWRRSRSRGRKVAPTKQREVKFQSAADRAVGSASARVAMPARSRGREVTSKHLPLLPTEHQDKAASQKAPTANQPRVPSPIPSLHDPEKDLKFSSECQELLRRMDFGHDFLLPMFTAVESKASASQDLLAAANHRPDSQQTISIKDALTNLPPTDKLVERQRRPQATSSVSSKAVSNLANMFQLARAKSNPNPSAVKGQSSSSPNQPTRTMSTTRRPIMDRSFLRMPSASSAAARTLRSPHSTMSVDTLAKIEAQVHNGETANIKTTSEKVSSFSSESGRRGPPSIPPERPLPALPPDAFPDQSSRHSADSGRNGLDAQKRQASAAPMILSRSSIRVVCQAPPVDLVVDPSKVRPMSPGLEQSTAQDKRRGTGAAAIRLADQSSLSSLASELSGHSRRSSQSYRRSICSARADKVKEKRLRDIATSKPSLSSPNRPTSSNSTGHQDVNTTTTPPPTSWDRPITFKGQVQVDQLDQFPAVPSSRRGSSVASVQSPTRVRGPSFNSLTSPFRQSLQKNTSTRQGQVLGQSNIFVVVDSDPVTARFRAGAMSPSPSIGSSNASGRPISPVRNKQYKAGPSSLREVTTHRGPNGPKPNTASVRVARVESPTHLAPPHRKSKRHSRQNSVQTSSSSDESTTPSINRNVRAKSPQNRPSRRPTKRRRWNSFDISLVKTLHENLEDYYGTILKQEERIRWQADQLRMMVRVIAPMNRARGVKGSYLEDIPDKFEHEDDALVVSQQYAQTMATGHIPRPPRRSHVRQSSSGGGWPLSKVNTKERVTKPGQGQHRRYNSTLSETGEESDMLLLLQTTTGKSTSASKAQNVAVEDPSLTALPPVDREAMKTTPAAAAAAASEYGNDKENKVPGTTTRRHDKDRVSARTSAAPNSALASLRQPPPVPPSPPLPRQLSADEGADIFSSPTTSGGGGGGQFDDALSSPGFFEQDGQNDANVFKTGHGGRNSAARLSVDHFLASTEQMDKALGLSAAAAYI